MTLNTLIIIILVVCGILFLSGLLLVLFLLGRSSVRDNPRKALIFIKTGRHVSRPIKGNMIGNPTLRGSRFKYGNNSVFVPSSYSENYLIGKRVIFISRLGQLIATPFDEDVTLADNEKCELIYELCESHIGSDAMKFLKGKNISNVIIIAIIAFVIGAIAVFGVIQFQDVMKKQAINKSPAIQQDLPKPIEVK